MALTTGSTITWSDISTVLTSVNTARTKFGLTSTTLTNGSKGSAVKAALVQELFTALFACNGKSLGQDGTLTVASISVPAVGSLIKPVEMSSIYTEANRIAGLNFSFFANFSFFGSSFNSSFKSSNFAFFSSDDSCFGFDSSFNSSNKSSNFAFFSTGSGAFNSSFDCFFTNTSGFNSSGNYNYFSSFQGPIGLGSFFTCTSD